MLTKTTTLPHTFEVYIPVSRMRADHKRKLIDVAGGLTIVHSTGSWVDPDRAICTDPVYICRISIGAVRLGQAAIMSVVDDLLSAGEQAVYWTHNGLAAVTEKADE